MLFNLNQKSSNKFAKNRKKNHKWKGITYILLTQKMKTHYTYTERVSTNPKQAKRNTQKGEIRNACKILAKRRMDRDCFV
jgi:hypothetical protein